jgi:hypothetical protein
MNRHTTVRLVSESMDVRSVVDRVVTSLVLSQPIRSLLNGSPPPAPSSSLSSSVTTSDGARTVITYETIDVGLPLSLIDIIIEYQLSFDSIAYAIELHQSTYFDPLPLSVPLVITPNETDFVEQYHDPNGIHVNLSQIAHQYWKWSTEYDDKSTRGRAWYKRSVYTHWGLHAVQLNPSVAVSYARSSKGLDYPGGYTLVAFMAQQYTYDSCSTDKDRYIPSHVGTADIIEAISSSSKEKKTSDDVIISCIMMLRNDPVDQLLMHLLSHTDHASSLQWRIACAHRGNGNACQLMSVYSPKGLHQQEIRWAIACSCQEPRAFGNWLQQTTKKMIANRRKAATINDDDCTNEIISMLPSYYHDWYRSFILNPNTSTNLYASKPSAS